MAVSYTVSGSLKQWVKPINFGVYLTLEFKHPWDLLWFFCGSVSPLWGQMVGSSYAVWLIWKTGMGNRGRNSLTGKRKKISFPLTESKGVHRATSVQKPTTLSTACWTKEGWVRVSNCSFQALLASSSLTCKSGCQTGQLSHGWSQMLGQYLFVNLAFKMLLFKYLGKWNSIV